MIRAARSPPRSVSPEGSIPVADLVEASGDLRFERELGELGLCTGMCSLVGEEGTLLVARTGRVDFSKEELDLLRGMGRVLALALRSIRLIGQLRERQTLLERAPRPAVSIRPPRRSPRSGEIGCLNGQGFPFSPPLPAEEIASFLAVESPAR